MELQANGTFAILNSWTWPSLEHLEEKCKWSLKSCNTKTILKWTHIRIRQRVWFYIYFPWGWSLTCECQGADVVEPVAALRRRRAHSLLSQDHRSSISHYAASHHLRGFPEGFLLDIFTSVSFKHLLRSGSTPFYRYLWEGLIHQALNFILGWRFYSTSDKWYRYWEVGLLKSTSYNWTEWDSSEAIKF